MDRRIPQIISGIVATILTVSFGWFLLPSFWFWVGFEIVAAMLVAGGCSGEWYLHHHPAGRKKQEKDEHHQAEARFIAMVSIGVIMELFVLAHSIREGIVLENEVAKAENEAAKASERAANTESNNLVLQAKLKTRIITDDERKNFIESLKWQPKGPVKINFDRGASANVRFYAGEIADLLIAAGYSVPGGADICDVKPILPADTSIEVMTKSLKDGPAYFYPMVNCLAIVSDKVVPDVYDAFFFNTNELWIYVANYR
jgi:hypothetical protein